MRKVILGVLAALACIVLSASSAAANVIPNESRPGQTVEVRMWCFVGTVSFTITGNGVSIPVGSGTPVSGIVTHNVVVPQLAPGRYTMVGIGPSCSGNPAAQVNVGFTVLSSNGGGGEDYRVGADFTAVTRNVVAPLEVVNARAGYFAGDVIFSLVESSSFLGSSSADPTGVASLAFTAPARPGDYTVKADGVDAEGVAVRTLTVFTVHALTEGNDLPRATVRAAAAPAGVAPGSVGATIDTPAISADRVVAVAVQDTTATREISAVSSSPRGALARTGADSLDTVRIALLGIAVGGALLVATRRRTVRR